MANILVYLSGPTGAGKSSALTALADAATGWTLIPEPHPTALLADLIVTGSTNAGRTLQEAFIVSRHAAIRDGGPRVIVDRSHSEDRQVFLPLHRHLGHLAAGDYDSLVDQCLQVEKSLPRPVACLYFFADPCTLEQRMRDDKRPPWLVKSLTTQLELYDDWLSASTWPITRIDTTVADPLSSADLRSILGLRL